MRILETTALALNDVLLVPQYSNVISRKLVDVKTTIGDDNKKLELKTPILSANMKTVTGPKLANELTRNGGTPVLHRENTIEEAIKDGDNSYGINTFVSIGVNGDAKDRFKSLYYNGECNFLIDIAHAHSGHCLEIIRWIKENYNVFIMAGNVCTYEGTKDLIRAGANCVKVGQGAGAVCTTRTITGHGYPMLSTINNCKIAAQEYGLNTSIIADGGIKNSGDIVKAIAAGADAVMLGTLFASTKESNAEWANEYANPGNYWLKLEDTKWKSTTHKIHRGSSIRNGRTDEGVVRKIKVTGTVKELMEELIGGIQSGFSYSGSHNIKEFQEKAVFAKITNNGYLESKTI
jgi:IMP dehydrogenase